VQKRLAAHLLCPAAARAEPHVEALHVVQRLGMLGRDLDAAGDALGSDRLLNRRLLRLVMLAVTMPTGAGVRLSMSSSRVVPRQDTRT